MLNRYGLVLPGNAAISHSRFTPIPYSDPIYMVMAIHASLFTEGSGGEFSNHKIRGDEEGPYYWIALAMRDLAAEYGKPVLLINGDFHEFIIDLPFSVSQGEAELPKYNNITRLQVYGAPQLKAVKVGVDVTNPRVFSI